MAARPTDPFRWRSAACAPWLTMRASGGRAERRHTARPADAAGPERQLGVECPGRADHRRPAATVHARDDVQFLSRVIDVVTQQLCGDARRVYATGHSGGGRMTSALACRLADKVAAVAPNAGLRAGRPDPDDTSVPEVEDCEPARPMPVLTFHGRRTSSTPTTATAICARATPCRSRSRPGHGSTGAGPGPMRRPSARTSPARLHALP